MATRTASLTLVAALAACAGLVDDAPQAMRIEPLLRIGGPALATAAAGHVALARQYAGEGRWALAAEQYRRAAAIEPSSADHFNGLGQAEAMLRQHPAAVDAFERAVALAPHRADLLNNLGYALLLAGQPTEAGKLLAQAVAQDPAYAQARFNLRLTELELAEHLASRRVAAEREAARQPPTGAPAPSAAPAMLVLTAPTVPALRISVPDEAPPVTAAALPARPEVQAVAAPPLAAPLPAGLRVQVANGNGVPGAAARLGQWLGRMGLARAGLANLPPYTAPVTTVQYRAGFEQQARAIAHVLPMSSMLDSSARDLRSDVRIVIGHDVVQRVAQNAP